MQDYVDHHPANGILFINDHVKENLLSAFLNFIDEISGSRFHV